MRLSIRGFLTAAVAISCAASLPVEAKRHTVTHHAASSHTTARASSHHSSHSRGSASGRSSAHVSRSRGRAGRHSIVATSHKRGRYGRSVAVSNHVVHHSAPPASYPEPHAENVQNANSLANVYRLYDRGVNERLEGHYEQATKTLREASNSYSSAQRGLTLEAMIEYELGQAAEANNNFSIAADAYSRSLRIKPNLIEASVRLASMLMKAGQPQAALSRARDSVASNPNDPRAHQILALILDNNGLSGDAKIERESADRLLRSRTSVNYADVPTDINVEPTRAPVTDQPTTDPPTPTSTPASPEGLQGGSEDEQRKMRQEQQWKLYQQQHGETPQGANEDELRKAKQEQQWRLYQQQHGSDQSNQRRPDSDRRPFQSSSPNSAGEFYRARVEPAGKPLNVLEKREPPSDFAKDSATKTYTPNASASGSSVSGSGSSVSGSGSSVSGSGSSVSGSGSSVSGSDSSKPGLDTAKTTTKKSSKNGLGKPSTPEPVDNDEMP